MNDFDYDNLQKKRLARNAKYRKGTVFGPKGCRLPHEYLTKKEREALNGELNTVNLNAKIGYEEFKILPKTLQEEYIKHQMTRFGVGLVNISEDLFGMARNTLTQWVISHNLNVPTMKGRPSRAAMASFRRWLDADASIAPVNEISEEVEAEPEIKPETETEANTEEIPLFRVHDYEPVLHKPVPHEQKAPERPYPATDLSLTLKGTPVEVLTTLLNMFPTVLDGDKTYRFTLRVDDFVL